MMRFKIVHIYNPNMWEVKAGGFVFQGHPEQYSEILYQNI